MKKPIAALAAVLLLTTAVVCYKNFYSSKEEKEELAERREGEREEGEEGEEEEQQSGAARQLNGWFQAKAFPDPNNISLKYQKAWEQYLEIKNNTPGNPQALTVDGMSSNWTGLGYCTDAGVRIGGRIVCLTIDPNNVNNLWVGSASGGIWRSTDAGANWTAVPTNLPVLGVSSILVDPSNSNIIYAGTGEVYHTEVGVMGYNVWKSRGTYGIGVIKSTNGGGTWTKLQTTVSSNLSAISSMAFLPGNSTTIFACATDGLWRSTNSGTSWSKIYTGINVRDVAINPTTTDQIVISVGNMTNTTKGIFRTVNGSNASPTWTAATGLPAYQGHIKIDNVGAGEMIASVGISSNTANSNLEIYRSTNFGSSWTAVGVNSAGGTTNHCNYQFWFAHTVAINPFDTDSLMFGGVGLYRYKRSTTVRVAETGPHADQHDIKFDPVRRGTVYVCNDGGVYKSTDGGNNFSAINNGLNATQFYASLGVSRQDATVMIGGLQDNGQVLYNGTNWASISWGGGDGTSCAIHPTNDNIILASRDAKQIFRSTNGGTGGSAVTTYWGFAGDSRTGFVAPIAIAPSNGNVVYQATDNIHISSDAGASFSNGTLGGGDPPLTPTNFIEQRHKTAIALAVSTTNSSKLYVSTSPFAQADNDANTIYVNGSPNVFKTTTPATTPYASIKGTLPNRFVMDFAISKNSDDSVYVVLGGFGGSHIYLTANGGTSWTDIGVSGTLPDVPFNAVLIDPIRPKTIYVGTDFGVYVSPDRGTNWYDYNTGFYDATYVMDLQVDANNKLIAATHGKGVFRSDLFTLTTLPVTFTSFTGVNRDDINELKWDVEQEFDLDHYELQRSIDGNNFQPVANINAFNSQAPRTYTHNDNVGSVFSSVFYYRLKAINSNGTYFYSDIVFIKSNRKSTFKVFGNPFTSNVSFRYNSNAAGKMIVQLSDMGGRIIRKEEQSVTTGSGYYTVDNLSALPAGVYILDLWINKDRYTQKIIKR